MKALQEREIHMKIKYMGAFSGNEEDLPRKPHRPGTVQLREHYMKKLALRANVIALVIIAFLFAILAFQSWFTVDGWSFVLGALASLVCAIPHEYIHAICFRETAYIYTNLKQGMLFVVGPEDMTKGRFIFMSLLPSIVFGLIPYAAGLVLHNVFLATLGATSLGMGSGDYINVWNALWQMPKGALTYLYGFHSFWYQPHDSRQQPAGTEAETE